MPGVSHQALIGGSRKGTMIEAINALGMQTSLQVCLDAADRDSYTSGQIWYDRSGNAQNFYLGSTSGSESSDPTFNGTAGQQSSSEYFSFDGGDFFRLTQNNPAWVDSFQKNNAVCGIATWVWINSTLGVESRLCGTVGNGGCWYLMINANGTFEFASYADGNGAPVMSLLTTATVAEDGWQFLAVSFDEGANTGYLRIGSTNETKSATMSPPGTTNSSSKLEIGGAGLGGNYIESGGRMASMCIWNRYIQPTEMTNLYNETKGRFGL